MANFGRGDEVQERFQLLPPRGQVTEEGHRVRFVIAVLVKVPDRLDELGFRLAEQADCEA
jgi:hypothetical protein